MGINWASIAAHGGIGKGKPRCLVEPYKASLHERKLAAAYALVNVRDENKCQVSGVVLWTKTDDERRLRTHHHLKGRNVKPEWIYQPKRIILVSWAVHQLLTRKVILVEGTDASKRLTFWWNRNLVKAGKEPMRLAKVI